MRKILLFPILFFGLFPNLNNLEASENIILNDVKNWFKDDYWIKKYSIIDESICRVLKETKKDFTEEDCKFREDTKENKVDADFLRKIQCDAFINSDFKLIKIKNIKEKVIDDCKRIFNVYRDDKDFDFNGFSAFYASFALDKDLPFYEGEYLNAQKSGLGKYYFSDGDVYIGNFKNDKRNGYGTLYWKSGDRYDGDFQDGWRTGVGTYHFKSGAIYEGEYLKNKPEGKGTMIFASGNRYVGDYKNGLRSGKGTYFYKDGDKYIGDFLNNTRNGEGTYYYSNGAKYEGGFREGKKEGFGTYFYSNGEKYIGYWLADKRNGDGIEFNKKGKIKEQGIWEDSSLVQTKKINLKELIKSKDSNKNIAKSDHESCLKAADYQGCMNYKKGIEVTKKETISEVNCINNVCNPEEAKIYGVDNLGLRVLPGYYFVDIPEKRAANFFSQPMKLNVNGDFGRYIHIQRIVRRYSEGYSGSLTTIPGIGPGASSTISYSPGQLPGVRQIVLNHVFDCEDKTFARFEGKRLIRSETKSGKKKKWLNFEEADGYTARQGIKACRKSKNYIMSLNFSPFDKFSKKAIKSVPKNKNSKINCDSPVWKNKPQCN